YRTGNECAFMDSESYDPITLTSEQLGTATGFLKENMNILVQFYQGQPIGVELPTVVELTVTHTEPGFKGDTATGGTKPATTETGLELQVPLFVEIGDVIRVDTRTGEYLSRA
uniref:elongation factor P n=1 Tax=Limnochorda pilosa TaxID=1555112 RepID=UPI0034E94BC6